MIKLVKTFRSNTLISSSIKHFQGKPQVLKPTQILRSEQKLPAAVPEKVLGNWQMSSAKVSRLHDTYTFMYVTLHYYIYNYITVYI